MSYLLRPSNVRAILTAADPTSPASMSMDQLRAAQAEMQTVTITDATLDALLAIREACKAEGIVASDRRWKKCLKAARASAYLAGESKTSPEDLSLLTDCLWREPKERPKLARVVGKLADPIGSQALEIVDAARETSARVSALRAGDRRSCISAAANALEEFNAQQAACPGAVPDSAPIFPSAASAVSGQRLRDDARRRRHRAPHGSLQAHRREQAAPQDQSWGRRDHRHHAGRGHRPPPALGALCKLTRRTRLVFMRDLLERQSLQYPFTGSETLGKGPLVVALDKSGSMDGPRDIWATALALALLDQAQRENRMFALLLFDASVKYEAVVKPTEPLPEAALFQGCAGGTSIDAALARALKIIETCPGNLRKSDVVRRDHRARAPAGG